MIRTLSDIYTHEFERRLHALYEERSVLGTDTVRLFPVVDVRWGEFEAEVMIRPDVATSAPVQGVQIQVAIPDPEAADLAVGINVNIRVATLFAASSPTFVQHVVDECWAALRGQIDTLPSFGGQEPQDVEHHPV